MLINLFNTSFCLKVLPHTNRFKCFEWDEHSGQSADIPDFNALIDFIDLHLRTLVAMYEPTSPNSQSKPQNQSLINIDKNKT